ncbi:RNA polymerase sigma factor (sigma-70 family) [Cytobacillus firmus]|uniref:RNA polymerase sigma factor (Sigma-70 family) n=2 Tax=Cytobacillus TaxID=2675230 RepID=A0A366K139_CYTFI|nr:MULTISPECIES: sigma-70 family RNA polymerase sigma factor [Cytobacillus]RBP95404.1 RNA polymerase sigma factor (sigma-70 family) [Cytobacillus firmus]TDX44245.1 RNA polymerase sigma factor (sigma-70 family) [Cytobacillus oceanisediminis]
MVLIIPVKNNPILPVTIRVKDIESIVSWFEQHQQSFYAIGWSYLGNQRKIEELFYRAILQVHKELPRFKSRTFFEMWVLSIFIRICREHSHNKSLQASEESDSYQELFHALHQLKEKEREVLVLTYIKALTKDETAQLLQVSAEQVKELLFSGLQSLRNGMGYGEHYHGCIEYKKIYMDYLKRNLERPAKIDFEMHIYHCQDCQEDLAALQEVMVSFTEAIEKFSVPEGFMGNIKERVAQRESLIQQKKNKRKRNGFIAASIFVLAILAGGITGVFSKLYYTWTEENQELRAFLQEDVGERLNLEAESDGVKIKIKSAIADDVQTLIFYEIEDTNGNNQFLINYDDSVYIEDKRKIMNDYTHQRYYPPDFESELNNKKKNTYHGKISLPPLKEDKGTIKLKINNVMKIIRKTSDSYMSMEQKPGEWNFEIPLTKQPSTEYALDENIEIEGVPVRLDKLILAPSATILQYGINNEQSAKRIEMINFNDLEVNNQFLKADQYGNSYVHNQPDINWSIFQANFEPLFEKETNEVKVQFGSVYLSIEDHKTIKLDASKEYPQTFKYAGSTISIDKVEIGQPSTVVFSNHEIKNRAYESLHYFIETEQGENSMEGDYEGVIVDKNGKEYDMNKVTPKIYEEMEQPLHFFTVQSLKLHGDKVIPQSLNITGYSKTKYLDDKVRISLD